MKHNPKKSNKRHGFSQMFGFWVPGPEKSDPTGKNMLKNVTFV